MAQQLVSQTWESVTLGDVRLISIQREVDIQGQPTGEVLLNCSYSIRRIGLPPLDGATRVELSETKKAQLKAFVENEILPQVNSQLGF